jgi:surface polysaccharide O-acyltransferase-like enzyme
MTQRRYDLDWLRIGAFALLILYHVGMYYVTWDWHVKSSHASAAIEPLMFLSNPWRLTLLFLISGAATRFMADKMSTWQLTKARMGRLWPPLLLAIFVIVPPQSYYEILEAATALGQDPGPWLDNFYVKYVTASGHWCDSDGCLKTPTYNHMWFVAYLIIYSVALLPLIPLIRRIPKTVAFLISGPGLFLTPWLFLFITRVTLFPIFGESHDFREDGYMHALYFGTFLFGFVIAKHQPFFDACVRWRWLALGAMFIAWGALMTYYNAWSDAGTPPDWLRNTFRGVRELQAWTAIVALIGFAHRNLRLADGPVRQVLTEAIFPVYLIHQTITVVAAHYLGQAGLPVGLEVPLLIAITVAGCWLFYDIGRRIPFLRIWIGLPSRSKVPTRPTDPSPRSHQPEALQ